MIEFNEIMQYFGQQAFSMVMCGALFWKMLKIEEVHREEIEKINQTMTASNEKITEALNNNTIALTQLKDKMEVIT